MSHLLSTNATTPLANILYFLSCLALPRPRYALYTYQGSDEPDVYDTGYSQNNTFDGNIINGGPQAIKMKQSDGNIIINNKFSNPGSIEWSDSTGNVVFGNTGLDGATKTRMVHPACFGSTDEVVLPDMFTACHPVLGSCGTPSGSGRQASLKRNISYHHTSLLHVLSLVAHSIYFMHEMMDYF